MTWRSGLARMGYLHRQRRYQGMAGNDLTEYQEDMDRILGQLERLNSVKAARKAVNKANAARVARLAAQLLDAPHAAVNLITERKQTTVGSTSNDIGPAGEGWCRNVVALGDVLAVNDVSKHALVRHSAEAKGIGAYLGVPLILNHDVVGALCVFDESPRTWSEMDAAKLQMLAEGLDLT